VSLSALGATVAVVSSPGTAGASIGSDRSKVSQLEQKILDQGTLVQNLVASYNRVQGRMDVIKGQIAGDHVRLVADHSAQAKAAAWLHQVALDAYVNAASGMSTLLSSSTATTQQEQGVYLGVASGSLEAAITTVQLDQDATSATEKALRTDEARTAATLRELATAREAAQGAIAADEAMLSKVSANLLALVTAANNKREAEEEQAAERKLAAAQATTTTTTPATTTTTTTPSKPPPPPPPPPPTPGSYSDPLRSISGLTPERIDQGVDYSGFGPIYAIGDGTVLNTVNAGWPGGTFIAYQLTDGPGKGLVVYAAEDIDPSVQVGQTVGPGTVIGQMYEGPTGIETGWADGSALGLTMAAEYGQFSGSNSTAFGFNFSQLLESVGAPGGILQNNPPTGGLPAGWPSW
jgi:murein DD-endopeptidase MepM/ murein hydrolase activator NlpD